MPCSKYKGRQRKACYATDGWGLGWSKKYHKKKKSKKTKK